MVILQSAISSWAAVQHYFVELSERRWSSLVELRVSHVPIQKLLCYSGAHAPPFWASAALAHASRFGTSQGCAVS